MFGAVHYLTGRYAGRSAYRVTLVTIVFFGHAFQHQGAGAGKIHFINRLMYRFRLSAEYGRHRLVQKAAHNLQQMLPTRLALSGWRDQFR